MANGKIQYNEFNTSLYTPRWNTFLPRFTRLYNKIPPQIRQVSLRLGKWYEINEMKENVRYFIRVNQKYWAAIKNLCPPLHLGEGGLGRDEDQSHGGVAPWSSAGPGAEWRGCSLCNLTRTLVSRTDPLNPNTHKPNKTRWSKLLYSQTFISFQITSQLGQTVIQSTLRSFKQERFGDFSSPTVFRLPDLHASAPWKKK